MKTLKITLITLFTLIGFSGITQNTTKAEVRQAKKDTILVKKLDLTNKEKADFLPLYHEYQTEKKALRQSLKAERKPRKKMGDMTEEEVEKVIQDSFTFKQKELDLKKKYHEKFKAVISVKKLAKLYRIEKKYKGKKQMKSKGKKRKRKK